MNKPSRQQQRKVYKLTWQDIDAMQKEYYDKGSANKKADFLEWLNEILKDTKGIGNVMYGRIIEKAYDKELWRQMAMSNWYLVKGMNGDITIMREDEIKLQTEVIEGFIAKDFLEAHKFKKEHLLEVESEHRKNDRATQRV